jgi:CRP/FNR family transcriptional regulator
VRRDVEAAIATGRASESHELDPVNHSATGGFLGSRGAIAMSGVRDTQRAAGRDLRPCGTCPRRAHGICGTVAGQDLLRLAALATIVDIARGQTFIHEGAPAEHFCILVWGSAKLYKVLKDGRRQIISFGYPGDLLGLAASDSYAFSAEAIEPIRICRLARQSLLATLRDLNAAEQGLLEVAVSDLVQAQERMLLLGRMTAIERLASFLAFQTTRRQARWVLQPRIRLPMSRSDIADHLGLNSETISRSLTLLEKQGVIALPNIHEVVIIDPSRLQALADGQDDRTTSATAARRDQQMESV